MALPGVTLVGNLAWIGFDQIPGGTILYWVYQILAVALLAAASMTALQDAQATEWRDVAIGEIPEAIVYRDPRGTFTRSVTITFAVAVLIMFLVRGQTTHAVPYYGVGVFMPIMVMGLAVRKHIQEHFTGRVRAWGMAGAALASGLGGLVFVGQIVGKWQEGGWVVLISFSILALAAHSLLISPLGYREPKQITASCAISPRPGRYGLHRRMAVAAHAGISLPVVARHHPLLCPVWLASPVALCSPGGGWRL